MLSVIKLELVWPDEETMTMLTHPIEISTLELKDIQDGRRKLNFYRWGAHEIQT